MDLSYNVVASKCAEQMARYQNCVTQNANGDWSSICRPEGKALAQCADDAVPHLAELKNACAQQITDYRACLDARAMLPDEAIAEQCGPWMKNLWKCSERAMQETESRQGVATPTSGGDSDRLV